MSSITPKYLEELEQLCAEARPLPFTVDNSDDRFDAEIIAANGEAVVADAMDGHYCHLASAKFMVAASNALPLLIERVRELENNLAYVISRYGEFALSDNPEAAEIKEAIYFACNYRAERDNL